MAREFSVSNALGARSTAGTRSMHTCRLPKRLEKTYRQIPVCNSTAGSAISILAAYCPLHCDVILSHVRYLPDEYWFLHRDRSNKAGAVWLLIGREFLACTDISTSHGSTFESLVVCPSSSKSPQLLSSTVLPRRL